MTRLDQIEEKVKRGERLDFADGMELFMTQGPPARRAAGQPGARAAARRPHVLQRQHALRGHQRVRGQLQLLRLSEAGRGHAGRAHDHARGRLGRAARLPRSQANRAAHGQRAQPEPALRVVRELLRGWKRVRPSASTSSASRPSRSTTSREKFGMSYREVLERLRAAGLDSMPGGGAEILDEDIRRRIAAGQGQRRAVPGGAPRGARARHPHQLHHALRAHRDLRAPRRPPAAAARAAGRDASGFQCFIPLAFHNENNGLARLPEPTAVDDLKTLAISRLLLDNVDHIKAYWVSMGLDVAQLALRFGADDLDGTIVHETIYHSAGSDVPMGLTRRRRWCG